MKKAKIILLFIVIALVVTSCTVPIRAIKKNPQKFVNKHITIQGKAIKVSRIPLTSLKILEVYDGTDTIYVLTNREVKKNVDLKFKGEIIAIGGKVTQQRAKWLVKKVADFLIEKKLVDKKNAIAYSKKVIELLYKITPKKTIALFMLED